MKCARTIGRRLTRARRVFGLALWSLLCVGNAGAAPEPPLAEGPERLKVLAAYHRGNLWTDELLTRIEAAAERLGVAPMDVDYLDARRLDEAQAFALQRVRLAGRRAVAPGDRLLLLDDAALRFYLAHAEALGEPSRVVALGINAPELQRRALARGVKLIETAGVAGESLSFLEAALGPPCRCWCSATTRRSART